ncbi:hypothetical protein [Halomonas sp. H5]|uniref:hypothetical protein n=1 Tax=Halomonas sp. H5 TaxID=3423910 RepID=UPI003D362E82
MQSDDITISTHPADNIQIAPELQGGDAYDALTLAIIHAKSAASMVQLSLNDASEEGRLLINPDTLSAALHGLETHLAIIGKLADRIHYAQEVQS